jgi:hypothetical protein
MCPGNKNRLCSRHSNGPEGSMIGQPETKGIEIDIRIEDLLGPLGYGDSQSVKPAIMDQIVSEVARCSESMSGKAMYLCSGFRRVKDSDAIEVDGVTIEDQTLIGSLDGAAFFAVAVCTVGAAIDQRIDEHFRSGDYLQGMIADVVGNRAVESVAEQCAALICAKMSEKGISASSRLSPGYGKWDVRGQHAVFSLLDPSSIGVSLNEYCMMQPNKSISFVIPLVEGEFRRDARPLCAECGFRNCAYRRK